MYARTHAHTHTHTHNGLPPHLNTLLLLPKVTVKVVLPTVPKVTTPELSGMMLRAFYSGTGSEKRNDHGASLLEGPFTYIQIVWLIVEQFSLAHPHPTSAEKE